MEDAEDLSVASSSRTVSLIILRKTLHVPGLGKVPAAADCFASEADASKEQYTRSAQARIIIIAR